jgi:hypothetical protein
MENGWETEYCCEKSCWSALFPRHALYPLRTSHVAVTDRGDTGEYLARFGHSIKRLACNTTPQPYLMHKGKPGKGHRIEKKKGRCGPPH